MKEYLILKSEEEKDYVLLDSGDGMKLERYGNIILSRPDPQAVWAKKLPESEWKKINASFGGPVSPSAHRDGEGKGRWTVYSRIPEYWPVKFGGLGFNIRLSTFKHTGIFPEHKPNWEWTSRLIEEAARPITVLNLFGYTGGATLAAAKAGADVVHLDGSKVAIGWAKENAKLSGLENSHTRWILDDAMEFVKREIKRGHTYDGIIMDPPAYGHGPNKEVWKIEDDLPQLISSCKKILSAKPLFLLINGYASGYSAISYNNLIEPYSKNGKVEFGELTIEENGGRLLPAGIFTRIKWGK